MTYLVMLLVISPKVNLINSFLQLIIASAVAKNGFPRITEFEP